MEDILYLFTYGTLQDKAVQEAVFGRRLKGRPDAVPGFELSETKAYGKYPIVVKADAFSKILPGKVYKLKKGELDRADVYEGKEYQRILVDLTSGKKAWLYIEA